MCKRRDLIIALKMKAFCNKELNLNLDNNPLVIAPFLSTQRAGWPPLFSSILCWVRNYNPREPPHHYPEKQRIYSVGCALNAQLAE